MKRAVIPYDFNAFGQAIKAARMAKGESRKNVSDDMNISPRYLANIENKGQQPSLQIFYELVTRYHISVDQFFFPNETADKTTRRRQLDTLLDDLSEGGLHNQRYQAHNAGIRCRQRFPLPLHGYGGQHGFARP